MDSDFFVFLMSLAVALSVAYGLVYWAYRAETDRSARVGLYLVYGFPGVLLTVAGLALTVYSREHGPLVLALGLGFTLPLVKPFRVALARVTPIDPESPVDMSALAILLAVLGLLIAVTWQAPGPDEITTVAYDELIVQLLAWIGLSYILVGAGMRRSFRQAHARLGLTFPTPRTIAISFAAFLAAMFVNGLTGMLTAIFQPDTSDEIERGLQELTGDFQNPLGAAVIAISAGVGEELFFRGALQPKFGIALTSFCFAMLHTNYGLSFVTLGIFGIGVVFGLVRRHYGTIPAMIAHGLVNFVAVLIQAHI